MTTCCRLLPGLDHFMDTIAAKKPLTGKSVAGILTKFNNTWIREGVNDPVLPGSVLTPGGYPIEFNFRSDDEGISYTLEPGLPHESIADKLDFIRSVIDDFDAEKNKQAAAFIRQQNHRFGCWISIRHGDDHNLAYKLYYEVTNDTDAYFLKRMADDIPQLPPAVKFKPMLVGVMPNAEGITEYYCKLMHADVNLLHKIFLSAGVSRQLPFVLSCLSWLVSKQHNKLFENLTLGVSFRIVKGQFPTLTLFMHCPQIFTSNAQARTQILSLFRQIGGQAELYEAVSEPLNYLNIAHPVHSVLSIKIKNDKEIACSVGLSPWG